MIVVVVMMRLSKTMFMNLLLLMIRMGTIKTIIVITVTIVIDMCVLCILCLGTQLNQTKCTDASPTP